MKTITSEDNNIIEIKKSKFIAYIYNVSTEKQCIQYLNALNIEHKDARHITYAYVLCSPAYEKCSDDGEPSGTAGKPILDCIKRNDLTNVMIAVVRYFGGVKLGAGGLTRAYSNSAKEVIDRVSTKELQKQFIAKITVKLDNKYLIENNNNIQITNVNYDKISDKIIEYTIQCVSNKDLIDWLRNICLEVEVLEDSIWN